MVFYKDLEANQFVVPGSNYHMRMDRRAAPARIFSTAASTASVAVPPVPQDPLKFRDGRRYTDRLKDAKAATELEDAVLVGEGKLDGQPTSSPPRRTSASWPARSAWPRARPSSPACCAPSRSKTPFILFAASGGARMQEGILSLMQMPRTTIAVQRLREAQPALHRRPDRSDDRRRHGLLRDAGRHPHR